MNSECAYLKFGSALSTCAAKNNHRFHSKEASFVLYFNLKITLSDDIFVYIALIYLMVYSNFTIQHCQ
jgi:hypothetical protein